jgi:hypothetical protein
MKGVIAQTKHHEERKRRGHDGKGHDAEKIDRDDVREARLTERD